MARKVHDKLVDALKQYFEPVPLSDRLDVSTHPMFAKDIHHVIWPDGRANNASFYLNIEQLSRLLPKTINIAFVKRTSPKFKVSKAQKKKHIRGECEQCITHQGEYQVWLRQCSRLGNCLPDNDLAAALDSRCPSPVSEASTYVPGTPTSCQYSAAEAEQPSVAQAIPDSDRSSMFLPMCTAALSRSAPRRLSLRQVPPRARGHSCATCNAVCVLSQMFCCANSGCDAWFCADCDSKGIVWCETCRLVVRGRQPLSIIGRKPFLLKQTCASGKCTIKITARKRAYATHFLACEQNAKANAARRLERSEAIQAGGQLTEHIAQVGGAGAVAAAASL